MEILRKIEWKNIWKDYLAFSIRPRSDVANTRTSRSTPIDTTHVLCSLLGEYDPSAGLKEYIYVDSQTAAKVVDDTAVVGQ